MKKILCIAPHLSTGGLPQYLAKKIELLKDDFEIYLIEWSDCTGGVFTVQRNKIIDLVDSNKFYTLGENKTEILDIISSINPDIIHLEEIPEYFMDFDIASSIYNTERNYSIVETSHDSSFDATQKKFSPDKFMFVSQWQINQYKDIDVPKVLVEYPIEYIDRPNRKEALQKLGLDPNKKHVLHIGLFTPRKNQAEFFEYARSLPEYEFHCVGNQADNFRHYWEPLMENKPNNLTWWNERTDVENFYQSMDLFLFTSRGTNNDKETMPLVIREAISHQIPVLIYNLPVYLDYFDKFNKVNYLNFNDKEKNVDLIKSMLEHPYQPDYSKEAYIVATYPNTSKIEEITIECLKSLQHSGRKIITVSHYPVSKEIQELSDFVIYDKNNVTTEHTFKWNHYNYNNTFDLDLNISNSENNFYHGPACHNNIYNAAVLAKQLGITKLYHFTYDYHLKDKSFIEKISFILDTHSVYSHRTLPNHNNSGDLPQMTMAFVAFQTEDFLSKFKYIENREEWDSLKDKMGAPSNGVEAIWYQYYKNDSKSYWEKTEDWEYYINNFIDHKNFSQLQYFSILPFNNQIVSYFFSSNKQDDRIIKVFKITDNDKTLLFSHHVTGQLWDYKVIDKEECTLLLEIYDSKNNNLIETKEINIDQNYLENILPNNGNITFKNFPSNKIKLLHLVTEPETNDKEKHSVENLKSFCDYTGITYDMRVNKIWKELPPAETCHRPQDIDWTPAPIGNGFGKLTPGHYGCYLAHRNAISLEDNNDYDFVLVFEGDTIIDVDFNELYTSLIRFNRIANENGLDLVGFGNPKETTRINGHQIEDVHCDVVPFTPAQSYLIPNKSLPIWRDKLENTKWEAFDLWIMNIGQMRSGIANKIYTKHLPGFSLVDQVEKNKYNDNPLIFVD